MGEKHSQGPFRPLGRQLKALRDKAQETLADTSGAVEIDVKQLASFELGQARPTEDILLLLISHFGTKEDDAVRLWELAGYGVSRESSNNHSEDGRADSTKTNSAFLFTDIVDVIVNNYGVMMNFMQSTGPGTPPETVAKIGMSREHAKSILKILQITLSRTEQQLPNFPKRIIAPDNNHPDGTGKN